MASQANRKREDDLLEVLEGSDCVDGENIAFTNYNNNKNDNNNLTQLAMYLRQRQQY